MNDDFTLRDESCDVIRWMVQHSRFVTLRAAAVAKCGARSNLLFGGCQGRQLPAPERTLQLTRQAMVPCQAHTPHSTGLTPALLAAKRQATETHQ